jgi:predicted RNA-binding protein (virulence factor B family)
MRVGENIIIFVYHNSAKDFIVTINCQVVSQHSYLFIATSNCNLGMVTFTPAAEAMFHVDFITLL